MGSDEDFIAVKKKARPVRSKKTSEDVWPEFAAFTDLETMPWHAGMVRRVWRQTRP